MDVASLLTLLLLAVALAVQPWSVLASVLLVTSEHGVGKVAAFTAGWAGALLVVAAVTFAAHPAVPSSTSTSRVLSGVELAAGLALGGYLVVRVRRPRPATPARQPKWLDRIGSMSPAAAFALGAFLPNYVVVIAAVNEMLKGSLTAGGLAAAAGAFVLVASLGVAAPLLVLVARRDRAEQVYQGWRTWLMTHGQAVLLTVLLVVAVMLLVKGLLGLLD